MPIVADGVFFHFRHVMLRIKAFRARPVNENSFSNHDHVRLLGQTTPANHETHTRTVPINSAVQNTNKAPYFLPLVNAWDG